MARNRTTDNPEKKSVTAVPPLTKVYIEPTSRCNLQCATCLRNIWEEREGDMSMSVFDRIIQGLKSFPTAETVAFWGLGEPLMHPSIVEMVRQANRSGLQTEMITNALLLDDMVSKGLVEAGLDTLIVSIDGTSQQHHGSIRSGASLEEVKKNVSTLNSAKKRLGAAKPHIGLEFVATKRNLHELLDMEELMKEVGARFAIVTNILPYTEDMKDEILYWISARDTFIPVVGTEKSGILMPPIDEIPENMKILSSLDSRRIGINSLELPGEKRRGYCRYANTGALAVAWNGLVAPCVSLLHTHTAYILGRLKNIKRHVVGDLNRNTLPEIWNDPAFAGFRKKVVEFQFSPCSECTGCELAETNEKDCCGNTFPVCGDCLWARGIVICP